MPKAPSSLKTVSELRNVYDPTYIPLKLEKWRKDACILQTSATSLYKDIKHHVRNHAATIPSSERAKLHNLMGIKQSINILYKCIIS